MFRVTASTFRQLSRASISTSSPCPSTSSSRAIPLRSITTNVPPETGSGSGSGSGSTWSEKDSWGTGSTGSGWGAATQTGQTDQSRKGMGDQTKNPTGTDYLGGVPPATNQGGSVTDKVKQMASEAAETVESGFESAKSTAKKGYEAAKDSYYNMKSDSESDMKQSESESDPESESTWRGARARNRNLHRNRPGPDGDEDLVDADVPDTGKTGEMLSAVQKGPAPIIQQKQVTGLYDVPSA